MIVAQGLTKFYGDKCAISDVNFDIKAGEIVGILGLNGAGKSTTLRILASLLLPSAGSVKINGLDIVENPHETRKQVGFLPDSPPLYNEMTTEDYLTFTAELRGLSRAAAKQRLEEVLEVTNTKDVRGDQLGTLSHGYRQRVGIAQSIIHNPSVLILDEPISGLDPVQIVEVRELIRSLSGQHTILVSSHILSEISQTCDRLLVIQDGHIVASGTEQQLTAKLAGSQRLQLVVRGELEPIMQRIRNLAGVTLCDKLPATTHRGTTTPEGTHLLAVETSADVREQLSHALVTAGVGLLELSPSISELEDVFLRLIKKEDKAHA